MSLSQTCTSGIRPPEVRASGAALVVCSALMSWKTLILLTGSESPIVVVLSGSMEPAFFRGDILFLNMGTAPLRTGEVVVYNLDNKDIPIVHRVIEVHERRDSGAVDILTKVCWFRSCRPCSGAPRQSRSLHARQWSRGRRTLTCK